MRVLLISTYELGRQPFGLASPAAWLGRAGAEVTCHDLSREKLREGAVRAADVIAFYVPMHTATRLAVAALPRIRRLNPRARLWFYGLYAPMNETYLRDLGADVVLGGEFEEGLVRAFEWLAANPDPRPAESVGAHGVRPTEGERRSPLPDAPVVSLARQKFLVPDRRGLPPLRGYAKLRLPNGETKIVGYTEASRGCKHMCRHCPLVPVYNGQFRIVQPEVVLEDIRRQVAAGAEHITFGDPDFFNGPRHALDIVSALHREFPRLTYDVTIKIEHLLKHANCLRMLRETGCIFVTSAVESVNDAVLARLDKGHTAADFAAVAGIFRDAGLALSPTFVAFTPWTTLEGYRGLLERIAEL
ncbi:MAG: radical SAM protein, partial [Acidobacteria bacterium]